MGHIKKPHLPIGTLVSLLAPFLPSAAFSAPQEAPILETHPGISLEPMYAEAVIAYNSKAPAQALGILDRVLKTKPDYLQALELRALVLKELKRPRDSRANYELLLKVSPPDKQAPYHFELGVLDFNGGQLKASLAHFEKAIAGKFNVGASHFFSGMAYFNLSAKEATLEDAESHFLAAADGAVDELKPPSHYYLGIIHYKNGHSSDGTYELIEAKKLAKDMPNSSIAGDIAKAVDAALAAYRKPQWYGSVAAMAGYNGNVSSLPSSASVAETISQQRTLQALLVANIGRMSPPMAPFQWIASYRGNFNLNSTKAASAYQFLTHTANLYLTLDPLARTSYGIKFEGNLSMSDQGTDDPAVGSIQFKKYSLTGDFGPYLRTQLKRGIQLALEAGCKPQKYYTQEEVSGTGFGARASFSFDRSSRYWNPALSLSFDRNNADGSSFRYWGGSVSGSNLFRISDKTSFTGSVTLTMNMYTDASPSRTDQTFSLHLGWVRQFGTKWSLLADANYSMNFSSQADLYNYTQPSAKTGVSHAF